MNRPWTLFSCAKNQLLFVLVFFGPVAVGGTYYVQALTIDWPIVVAGLAWGFLSKEEPKDQPRRSPEIVKRHATPASPAEPASHTCCPPAST